MLLKKPTGRLLKILGWVTTNKAFFKDGLSLKIIMSEEKYLLFKFLIISKYGC